MALPFVIAFWLACVSYAMEVRPGALHRHNSARDGTKTEFLERKRNGVGAASKPAATKEHFRKHFEKQWARGVASKLGAVAGEKRRHVTNSLEASKAAMPRHSSGDLTNFDMLKSDFDLVRAQQEAALKFDAVPGPSFSAEANGNDQFPYGYRQAPLPKSSTPMWLFMPLFLVGGMMGGCVGRDLLGRRQPTSASGKGDKAQTKSALKDSAKTEESPDNPDDEAKKQVPRNRGVAPPLPLGKGAGKGPKKMERRITFEDGESTPKTPGKEVVAPFGKRLHWKALPKASIDNSVFAEIDPWSRQCPPLDTERIKDVFAPKPDWMKRSIMMRQRTIKAGSEVDVTKVSFFGHKWTQNFQIILRQVPMPIEDLCQVLMKMDIKHPEMTPEALDHLHLVLMPPLIDVPQFFGFNGDPSELCPTERVLLPLTKVPRVQERVRLLWFGKSMTTRYEELLRRVGQLRKACLQLQRSAALRTVLASTLRVGNYLNNGVDSSIEIEVVRGVLPSTLIKLKEFAADQKHQIFQKGTHLEVNALHFVALHLSQMDPEMPQALESQVSAALEAEWSKRESISDIFDEVKNFLCEGAFAAVQASQLAHVYEDGGSALSEVRKIAEDASELMHRVEVERNSVFATVGDMLRYFGNSKTYTLDDNEAPSAAQHLIANLRELLLALEVCWRELARLDADSAAMAEARARRLGKSTTGENELEAFMQMDKPCVQQ